MDQDCDIPLVELAAREVGHTYALGHVM